MAIYGLRYTIPQTQQLLGFQTRMNPCTLVDIRCMEPWFDIDYPYGKHEVLDLIPRVQDSSCHIQIYRPLDIPIWIIRDHFRFRRVVILPSTSNLDIRIENYVPSTIVFGLNINIVIHVEQVLPSVLANPMTKAKSMWVDCA